MPSGTLRAHSVRPIHNVPTERALLTLPRPRTPSSPAQRPARASKNPPLDFMVFVRSIAFPRSEVLRVIDFAQTSPSNISSPPVNLEQLGDEIAELAAHIHAATYRLLVLISEFDKREGWDASFKTCAHWLSWRTGIAMGSAREKVRVAHALERLPLLRAGMRNGELSYSKARALTRVANPENEEGLIDFAPHGTASHVEKIVRAWRRVDRLEDQLQEQERHRTRELSIFPDEDGMYLIRGRLDPEVGAVLMSALEAAGDALFGRSARFGGRVAPDGAGASDRQPPEQEPIGVTP